MKLMCVDLHRKIPAITIVKVINVFGLLTPDKQKAFIWSAKGVREPVLIIVSVKQISIMLLIGGGINCPVYSEEKIDVSTSGLT